MAGGDAATGWELAMHEKTVPVSGSLCVWMSAGLLTYKLCDRDFDCDHCPLDAALRGRHRDSDGVVPLSGPSLSDMLFPADLLYSAGHCWVGRMSNGGKLRCGLDAFAAALIGHVEEVSWSVAGSAGESASACEIDVGLGTVSLRLPLAEHHWH